MAMETPYLDGSVWALLAGFFIMAIYHNRHGGNKWINRSHSSSDFYATGQFGLIQVPLPVAFPILQIAGIA
jgi:hypothetical protein